MRSVVFDSTGGPEVLRLVDRPVPEPGPGEVLVRVRVSGVNPTDWKTRAGATPPPGDGDYVPHQDGAGDVEAVGAGVDGVFVGQRVWLWLGAFVGGGTAAEYAVVPQAHAVPMAESASYDLGASLGVPALTAHRALTVAEAGPRRLEPWALHGRTVLVAGGAGAVGHAAIELARWAGAEVVTTVSSEEKAALARRAGAHHIVDYTLGETAGRIDEVAPDGIHLVVEVAPAANAALDVAVCANGASIAYYANNGGDLLSADVRGSMSKNLRWQGVLLYSVADDAKRAAVDGVARAVADGALRVGADAGLPLHRFGLEETAAAQTAVEDGAVGKVLVDC